MALIARILGVSLLTSGLVAGLGLALHKSASHPGFSSSEYVIPVLFLACAATGAGLAVLPRYLCASALERGDVVPLHDPAIPPLRTYFLVVRTGTLALPHIARAHEWLLRTATGWA